MDKLSIQVEKLSVQVDTLQADASSPNAPQPQSQPIQLQSGNSDVASTGSISSTLNGDLAANTAPSSGASCLQMAEMSQLMVRDLGLPQTPSQGPSMTFDRAPDIPYYAYNTVRLTEASPYMPLYVPSWAYPPNTWAFYVQNNSTWNYLPNHAARPANVAEARASNKSFGPEQWAPRAAIEKREGNRKSDQMCINCQTKITSLWRRNAKGESNCNACGLYYKIYKTNRPISMKKDNLQRQKRKSNITEKTAKGGAASASSGSSGAAARGNRTAPIAGTSSLLPSAASHTTPFTAGLNGGSRAATTLQGYAFTYYNIHETNRLSSVKKDQLQVDALQADASSPDAPQPQSQPIQLQSGNSDAVSTGSIAATLNGDLANNTAPSSGATGLQMAEMSQLMGLPQPSSQGSSRSLDGSPTFPYGAVPM